MKNDYYFLAYEKDTFTIYLFFNENRNKFLQTPRLCAKDIIGQLGSAWKALPESEKQKYIDQSNKIAEQCKNDLPINE